jgi:ribosomal protein S18 acetylase RimI-like enzyme
MSAEFNIRPYQGGGDRRQLELIQLPVKYIRQYTNSPPLHYLLKLVGICTNYLYLMTPSGSSNVVGTILLRKRLQGFQAGYTWKIHAVYVAPELRGRGLGVELLTYVFERLRERGADDVSLKVDETNEPAVRLYRKYGFTEKARIKDQIIFSKRVNDRI